MNQNIALLSSVAPAVRDRLHIMTKRVLLTNVQIWVKFLHLWRRTLTVILLIYPALTQKNNSSNFERGLQIAASHMDTIFGVGWITGNVNFFKNRSLKQKVTGSWEKDLATRSLSVCEDEQWSFGDHCKTQGDLCLNFYYLTWQNNSYTYWHN